MVIFHSYVSLPEGRCSPQIPLETPVFQVAKSSLELQRDLAQANDRSLVVNAENQSQMDKET